MWETDAVDPVDALRQGDLLDGVVLPILKAPLALSRVDSTELAVVPVRSKWGLVVSQCCDNENGDYVAIRGSSTANKAQPNAGRGTPPL